MTVNGLITSVPVMTSAIKIPVFVRNVGPVVAILAIWAFLYFVVRGRQH
jgi:hypothetical protein